MKRPLDCDCEQRRQAAELTPPPPPTLLPSPPPANRLYPEVVPPPPGSVGQPQFGDTHPGQQGQFLGARLPPVLEPNAPSPPVPGGPPPYCDHFLPPPGHGIAMRYFVHGTPQPGEFHTIHAIPTGARSADGGETVMYYISSSAATAVPLHPDGDPYSRLRRLRRQRPGYALLAVSCFVAMVFLMLFLKLNLYSQQQPKAVLVHPHPQHPPPASQDSDKWDKREWGDNNYSDYYYGTVAGGNNTGVQVKNGNNTSAPAVDTNEMSNQNGTVPNDMSPMGTEDSGTGETAATTLAPIDGMNGTRVEN